MILFSTEVICSTFRRVSKLDKLTLHLCFRFSSDPYWGFSCTVIAFFSI